MAAFGALRTPRNILFGKGQRNALGWSARALGTRILVCTDARLAADSTFHSMVDDLRHHGLAVRVYDQTAPELPLACVEECIQAARGFDADVIAGVGGGSCMDLAKVVALLLTHGGQVSDYFGEFKVPGSVLPLIAIPTTAGTGSEVTPVAVIDDPSRNLKGGIASPHLIPHTAICDPELTFSCPPGLTAVAGADALTHAIEAFTALPRPATPTLAAEHVFVGKNMLSDHHALQAIEQIGRSLRRAVEGHDEAAREGMMLGALSAGIAFGTAGTAAAHALQYPVGHLTHSAHGVGVALLLPYVMEYNRPHAVTAYARVALALGIERDGRDDESLSRVAVDAVAGLFRDIGIPRTLDALGVAEDQLEFVAEQAFTAQRLIKNNPRPLDVAGLGRITAAAYHGTREALASTAPEKETA